MQKYIKKLTLILAWILLSPFLIIGFVAATIMGTTIVGAEIAKSFWDKANKWINND